MLRFVASAGRLRGGALTSSSYSSSSFSAKVNSSSLFRRAMSSSSSAAVASERPPRDQMHYDTVIVGAGPAGLSAAIRLKQLAVQKGTDISVCVIEKGAEVGAHILSGNVFEPLALTELFPDWKELGAPLETKAGDDNFLVLSENSSFPIPNILLPPQLHNEGNYIISLSKLVRWLAGKAEELGVEIYPGFAASEVVYGEKGNVIGVATRDVGIGKDDKPKDTFASGVELIGRQTLFSEGCRGSCSEEIMKKFNLREGKDVQTYGIGIKEVWEIPKENFKSGLIQHTLGWPLQDGLMSKVFGGTFLYHMEPNLVLTGMVVGLDYANPYLNPYQEFQRWKKHPAVMKHLEGGTCISYGARALNEGGYHAIPKLTFPGGALLGCSAGFLNSVKIKGSHTAMKSGMVAAEAIYPLLTAKADETVAVTGAVDPAAPAIEAVEYEKNIMTSWVAKELFPIRNTHTAFKSGLLPGMLHTSFSCFISKGNEPWTLRNIIPDSKKTEKASLHKPIEYPRPDGKISFDLLSNLARSGTSHEADQPAHLRIKSGMAKIPSEVSITEYAGPEQRFCPAGVYEYAEKEAGKKELVINAQNCVHCKTCSIKMPEEYIDWTVPEGSGGPGYTVM